MNLFTNDWLVATGFLICVGCAGGPDDASASSSNACDRWKDAALRYSHCNPAQLLQPHATDRCLTDQEVAQRGPLPTLAACADNLESLLHDCRGLDAIRQAYHSGDDQVVFDYVKKTGERPTCDCDPPDPKYRTPPRQSQLNGPYQCFDLLVHPDAGYSD